MKTPLWKFSDLVDITKGTYLLEDKYSLEKISIFGFSIDTRTIEKGDLFVALKGNRNGHNFISDAFASGAAAALVSEVPKNCKGKLNLLVVEDVLNALGEIATAARSRFNGLALSVTGSVGKTTTKEMLKHALQPIGKVHASIRSFNNFIGVSITMATLPPDADFGIFEIGMNRPGEIEPLSMLVRPDHVIITTTGQSHTENFEKIEDIAKEKASIAKGLRKGGMAFLCMDGELQKNIQEILKEASIKVVSFGSASSSDFRIASIKSIGTGFQMAYQTSIAQTDSCKFNFWQKHFMLNAMGVLAFIIELGLDLSKAKKALRTWSPIEGRGLVYKLDLPNESSKSHLILIDDSYNSNPISLRASLENFIYSENSYYLNKKVPIRLAILGDMLELGEDSINQHAKIADLMAFKKIEKICCVGYYMKYLYNKLPLQQRAGYYKNTTELLSNIGELIKNVDVVLIKGSNGLKFSRVIEKIKSIGKIPSN